MKNNISTTTNSKGGNEFQRLKPVLITPATTYVEVTATSSSIEVAPCDSVNTEFIIYNYAHRTSDITVTISDTLNFLQSSSNIQ